jgi:K+-transporting ATPase ATPase C chain
MATPIVRPAVRQVWAGVRLLLVLTVVFGLAYPLAMTAVAQLAFHDAADGSLLRRDGEVVGSSLLGQSFAGHPEYVQSRPSAAGDGYDPTASGGSNLGPQSSTLVGDVEQRRSAILEQDASDQDDAPPTAVAPDALLASGSGLDPHISPEYAAQQVQRVARARGMSPDDVAALVQKYTSPRLLGFLGEPRVNVLELNLALDQARGEGH